MNHFYALLVGLLKLFHGVFSPFSKKISFQNIDRYHQCEPLEVGSWFVASSLGESKLVENIWNLDGRINAFNSLVVLQTPWALKSILKSYPRGNFRLNPFDSRGIWRDWLLSSKPKCVYLVEGEVWPNLLLECRLNDVEIRWVSALITSRARRRWTFFKRNLVEILKSVQVSCADEETYKFLKEIGVKSRLGSSLKPLGLGSVTKHANMGIDSTFGLACVSWHYAEQLKWGERILEFQKSVVIQLRHPGEQANFEKWFKKQGLNYTVWPDVIKNTPCLVVEFGLTGEVVDCSELVCMGGSFSPNIGVHNVLEPISVGRSVIVGPWIEGSKYKEWEELFEQRVLIKIASSMEEANTERLQQKEVLERYQDWLNSQQARQRLEWESCAYEKEG